MTMDVNKGRTRKIKLSSTSESKTSLRLFGRSKGSIGAAGGGTPAWEQISQSEPDYIRTHFVIRFFEVYYK